MLLDRCTTNAELRKREVYWQQRPKTFFPNDLNERWRILFIIHWQNKIFFSSLMQFRV